MYYVGCVCAECVPRLRKQKKLNGQKNLPFHKRPSFLSLLFLSQNAVEFEEWNCHLFLVGLVTGTGGWWLVSMAQKFWFLRSLNNSLQVGAPGLDRQSVRPSLFPRPTSFH